MKIYYVYILLCSNKMFYTGITSNLTQRYVDHQRGKHKNSYTYSRRPLKLVFFCEFTDVNMAILSKKTNKEMVKSKKRSIDK